MDHLEEIRSKLAIEEVVGGYIQLKKAGRNLKGLCPFHNDSKPSFTVSPEKGIAYCFSCNTGGDIFKFIQLIENVEFPEAVKILADRANVKLPDFKPENQNKRLQTIEINQITMKFFINELKENPNKKKYFLNRGLSEETISEFKLGYAPNSFNELKDHLKRSGYSDGEILEAGVVTQRSIADKNSYDKFRDRLIFPIFDHQGNPVGFGGRVIDQGEPKYLNSPDTPAYNKSIVLYGLNVAKDSVKKENLAIFVEGYMDVIASHQAGTKNVVATSGTALTPQQLKLIKRYTKNIALCFDGDSAGHEATRRAIEIAQESELNVKIITVPNGKDPDECIKNSPEEWIKAAKNPIAVMDFYFTYANQKFDKSTIDGKKEYIKFILPIIKQYPTDFEQGEYLKRLATEIQTDLNLLWNDLRNLSTAKQFGNKAVNQHDNIPTKQRVFSHEEFLLGFIFHSPSIYPMVKENLITNIPIDHKTEKFYNLCEKVYNREGNIEISVTKADLSEDEAKEIDIYYLKIGDTYSDFSDSAIETEVKSLIKAINLKNIDNAQKQIVHQLRSVTDPQEKMLLLNQSIQISKLKAKIS